MHPDHPHSGAFEHRLEGLIFASRWLLAPFFVGLIFAIAVLLIKFAKELFNLTQLAMFGSTADTVFSVLSLVDTALIAGLLLIMVFSGYENFVSKLDTRDHVDRPAWMGKVGFSDLKLKLIGAIVAISGVELLKVFLTIEAFTQEQVMWKVLIHLTLAATALLFAITDWVSDHQKAAKTTQKQLSQFRNRASPATLVDDNKI
ncbi:MAG: TIGR00645 family protein [Thioalkalivibrionaceae bacterium]